MRLHLPHKTFVPREDKLLYFFVSVSLVVSLFFSVPAGVPDAVNLLRLTVTIAALFACCMFFVSTGPWIFTLFILLPLRGFQFGSFSGGGAIRIGDIIIGYMFVIWLIGRITRNETPCIIRSCLDVFIILFIGFYLCALAWSSNSDLGLLRVAKFVRNFLFYILVRELFIAGFAKSYQKLTAALVFTAIPMAITYILVILPGVSFNDIAALYHKKVLSSTDLSFMRTSASTYSAGAGLFLSGPQTWLTLTAVFVFGTLESTTKGLNGFLKVVLIILLFLGATIITLSRSAMILVTAIVTVLLVGSHAVGLKRNRKLLLLIIALSGIVLISLGGHKLISKRFTNPFKDGSWEQRVDLGAISFKAFLQHPVIGIGPGSNYSWQQLYTTQEPSRLPDNMYLNILSETGFIGFILFLCILFIWMKNLVLCIADRRLGTYFRNIAVTILAFSVGYLSIALIGQEFEAFECWIMLGITSALSAIRKYNLFKAFPVLHGLNQ